MVIFVGKIWKMMTTQCLGWFSDHFQTNLLSCLMSGTTHVARQETRRVVENCEALQLLSIFAWQGGSLGS